jgi:hypothetical protein
LLSAPAVRGIRDAGGYRGGKVEIESLLAAIGGGAAVSVAVRTIALLLKARHPKRVVLNDGEDEVSLDLSNRREALRYLEKVVDPDRRGR